MIKRAKTKNIITILSGVLVAVFACMVGLSFASIAFTNIYTTKSQPTAYAGNQQLEVVNETSTKPIPFGNSSQGYNISIQYAMCYDFDLRLEYSLSWSGGDAVSTENVILTFANRDDYIVDGNYIYKASSIPAGSGKLNIITGVEFVDVNDYNYYGQTLTIKVTATMYKTNKKAYNVADTTHPLYASSSDAWDTWCKYRNNEITTGAYVMMYNYHYDYDHGISYPNPRGAYAKNVTTVGNTTVISNPDWLGGNRAYGGVGAYIITGNNPVYLTARVAGIWRDPSTNAQTEETPDLAYENNIKFNYATDLTKQWNHASWDNITKLFETRTYSHYIPANTTCYIEIIDSIEITSVSMPSANYENYRIVTNSIQLNGTSFSGKLSTGTISAGSGSTNNAYTNTISVVNSSTYSNIMADMINAEEAQSFETNVTFINNTATPYTLSGLSLGLNYRLSNGLNGFDFDNDAATVTRPEETENTPMDLFKDTQGTGANYTVTGNAGNYLVANGTYKLNNSTYVLAPYSSITVLSSFQVSANIVKNISATWSSDTTTEYDLYLEIVPSISATTAENVSADVSIEAKQVGNNVVFYAKNNTNTTLSNVSMAVYSYSYDYGFDSTPKPKDWDYAYWKYYGSQNFNSSIVSKEGYGESFSVYSRSKSITVLLNTTITGKTLQPNETIVIATADGKNINDGIMIQLTTLSGTSTAPSAPVLINAGTSDAMIVNFSSTNSYYVRFTGTYAGTDTDNIKTSNGYNYYIGILRPGQVLRVPMSGGSGSMDTTGYNAGTAYTSTISSWDTSLYENYFK